MLHFLEFPEEEIRYLGFSDLHQVAHHSLERRKAIFQQIEDWKVVSSSCLLLIDNISLEIEEYEAVKKQILSGPSLEPHSSGSIPPRRPRFPSLVLESLQHHSLIILAIQGPSLILLKFDSYNSFHLCFHGRGFNGNHSLFGYHIDDT